VSTFEQYEFLAPAIIGLLLASKVGTVTHPSAGAALWPLVAAERGISSDSQEWIDGNDKFTDVISDVTDTMIERGLIEAAADEFEMWRYSLAPNVKPAMHAAFGMAGRSNVVHLSQLPALQGGVAIAKFRFIEPDNPG